MGLEAATFVSELVATNPVGATDNISDGDNHIRMIKATLQASFPNADRAFYIPDHSNKTAGTHSVLEADENKIFTLNAGAGALHLDLPAGAGLPDGWRVFAVRTDASSNDCDVRPASGSISGLDTLPLVHQYHYVEVVWAGAWYSAHWPPRREFVPGMVALWASGGAPPGWQRCNGDAISRTGFAELFAEIGTDFGVGNGSSTFNVPDIPDIDAGTTDLVYMIYHGVLE